jgi:hypothetical protein
MNAYFFKMTSEERSNILDQHKEIYDGYVTSYAQQPNQQPLYVQDYANDKGGINVNNRGEVSTYGNMRINEMRHDGKSTGLFSDEEPKEGYISAGVEYSPEETFESEFEVVTDFSDDDDNFKVNVGAHRDMIGDGNHDLGHGVFGDEDESDMVLVSPEVNFDDEDDYSDDEYLHRKSGEGRDFYDEDELVFNLGDEIFDDEDDIDDEEVEGLFDDLRESLDMFKRFTKYN